MQTKIKIRISIVLLISIFLTFSTGAQAEADKKEKTKNHVITSYSLVMQTQKKPLLLQLIQKTVADKNGFIEKLHSSQQYDYIIFKIPDQKAMESLIEQVSAHGVIISRKKTEQDFGEEMVQLQSEIQSMTKHFQEMQQLFAKANFSQALEIELEMKKIVEKLEELKGRSRYLQTKSDEIECQIHFSVIPSRRTNVSDLNIDWLEKLHLGYFFENF